MGSILSKSIEFAVKAHDGQVRKGTNIPYITHPIEVMGIVSTMTSNETVIAAAVLHDTLEDAGVTGDEIVEAVGDKIVLTYVKGMSENKRKGTPSENTWYIRKQETIDWIKSKECPLGVKVIALADKLSNVRSIKRDYDVIGERIFERFNVKDPAKHKWYYESFIEGCKELEYTAAYKEYKKICEELFKNY